MEALCHPQQLELQAMLLGCELSDLHFCHSQVLNRKAGTLEYWADNPAPLGDNYTRKKSRLGGGLFSKKPKPKGAIDLGAVVKVRRAQAQAAARVGRRGRARGARAAHADAAGAGRAAGGGRDRRRAGTREWPRFAMEIRGGGSSVPVAGCRSVVAVQSSAGGRTGWRRDGGVGWRGR